MTTAIFDLLRDAMRQRFGGSVTKLAEACDTSVQLASRWVTEDERKRITPSPASCTKIARGLGFPPAYVSQLAGHLPTDPQAQVDARRHIARDQIDRWLEAVGEENEEYFWADLKAKGDSTVHLIRQLRTAVSTGSEAPVSGPSGERAKRGRQPRDGRNGPLSRRQHPTTGLLDRACVEANVLLVA